MMRARGYSVLVAGALLALFIPATAMAQGAPLWSDRQLTDYSDYVLTGEVVGVAPGWDHEAGLIYTYVTVEVDEVLKGWVPYDTIVIKQLGGTAGLQGLAIGGQAEFETGEDVLLFLETRPRDQTLYTAALWQGKWEIEGDGEDMFANVTRSPFHEDEIDYTDLPGSERPDLEFANPDETGELGDSRWLWLFREEIRAWAGEASRQPRVGAPARMSPADVVAPDALPPAMPIPSRVSDALTTIDDDPDDPDLASDPFAYLGFGWAAGMTGTPITVIFHKKGEKITPGKENNLIIASGAAWSGLKGSKLVLNVVKGKVKGTQGCAMTNRNDLQITIVFGDPCGEIANGGGILAIGGAWFFPGMVLKVVKGTSIGTAVSGFVITNSDNAAVAFVFAVPACFADIILHELGHAIGLAHSNKPSAIMFPTISNNCLLGILATLAKDDRKAMKKLY